MAFWHISSRYWPLTGYRGAHGAGGLCGECIDERLTDLPVVHVTLPRRCR